MNRAFFPVRKTRDRSVLLLPIQEPPPPRPEPEPASLVNSWYFLIPLGLICVGMLVARALGYVR